MSNYNGGKAMNLLEKIFWATIGACVILVIGYTTIVLYLARKKLKMMFVKKQ